MFHLLAYNAALGINAADTDLTAASDSEFSRRNNHVIFTEDYNLLWAAYLAASATRARFNIPRINAYGRAQIWPVERSATIPDEPGVMDLRDFPMDLPKNEEIAIEGSNNLGAATEQSNCLLCVAPPDWNRNIPRGEQMIILRASQSVTGVAQTWSGLTSLVFAENLRGGWYTIVGMTAFAAGVLAARLVFARPRIYQGRKLRPGVLATEAIGNTPWRPQFFGMGVFGSFWSSELPQIEIFPNAAGAVTVDCRLACIYRGDNYPGF